jgi:hypothetical protein
MGAVEQVRLFEAEHPYYAERGNYYSNDCHYEYANWRGFAEALGDSDPDMNLVYRWDWDSSGGEDGVNYISIYFVGQRKAVLWSTRTPVLRAEEPEVRAWLEKRAETIVAIWAPILSAPVSLGRGE